MGTNNVVPTPTPAPGFGVAVNSISTFRLPAAPQRIILFDLPVISQELIIKSDYNLQCTPALQALFLLTLSSSDQDDEIHTARFGWFRVRAPVPGYTGLWLWQCTVVDGSQGVDLSFPFIDP